MVLANTVVPSLTFTPVPEEKVKPAALKSNTVLLTTEAAPKLASTPSACASNITARSSSEAPVSTKRVSVPTLLEYKLPLTTTV